MQQVETIVLEERKAEEAALKAEEERAAEARRLEEARIAREEAARKAEEERAAKARRLEEERIAKEREAAAAEARRLQEEADKKAKEAEDCAKHHNQSIRFDGKSSYIDIDPRPVQDDFTISFWFRPEDTGISR